MIMNFAIILNSANVSTNMIFRVHMLLVCLCSINHMTGMYAMPFLLPCWSHNAEDCLPYWTISLCCPLRKYNSLYYWNENVDNYIGINACSSGHPCIDFQATMQQSTSIQNITKIKFWI